MEFEIKLKDEVYDEIFTLMKNIDSLNDGKEIGGWLLGEWNFENNKGKLLLDQFIIPKQKVSKTEVDISPESMVDTVKEIGIDNSNRIKAHWHIHPFGKGKTEWSGTDESKIKDFMDPTKQREIFVFLLSSEDWIKARIEINIKGTLSFIEQEFILKKSFDNVEVFKESDEVISPYLDKLKERIKEKVEVEKYSFDKYDKSYDTNYWNKYGSTSQTKLVDEVEDLDYYALNVHKKMIIISMSCEFADFIERYEMVSEELSKPDQIVNKKKDKVSWRYRIENNQTLNAYAEEFDQELALLSEEYNREIMIEEMEEYNQGYKNDDYYQRS